MAGATLFFSRNCPHCEKLFRSGLVSPTVVRLVPVEAAGARLPPEIHSVPALWLPETRKLLLGKDVISYFQDKQSAAQVGSGPAGPVGPGQAAASQEPHPFLGDGGVGFSAFGPSSDDAPAGMGSFLPVPEERQEARGGGGGMETRMSREAVDLDAYKSKRDMELADILGRQKQTF